MPYMCLGNWQHFIHRLPALVYTKSREKLKFLAMITSDMLT